MILLVKLPNFLFKAIFMLTFSLRQARKCRNSRTKTSLFSEKLSKNMNNCIYCSATLSEKGVFCPQCAKQSKCKNCGDLLEVNAKACVMCGTLIEGNSTTVIQT